MEIILPGGNCCAGLSGSDVLLRSLGVRLILLTKNRTKYESLIDLGRQIVLFFYLLFSVYLPFLFLLLKLFFFISSLLFSTGVKFLHFFCFHSSNARGGECTL